MGATVNLGVVIGDGARVGNSAVVKKDVPPGGIVRAGSIWPEREAAGSSQRAG
jgi:serine acetyltransferase